MDSLIKFQGWGISKGWDRVNRIWYKTLRKSKVPLLLLNLKA